MTTAGLLLLISAALYFIPAVIALKRDVQHTGTIVLINVLLGWTILGWIAALIWAIVEKPVERSPGELDFDEATGLPRGKSN